MNPAQDENGRNRHRVSLAIVWALALLTTIIAYWPGLQGPFVLDDFNVLDSLGDFGGVRDWATFKAYILGGPAGPTGRPLAMFSFLVDANNWPADPWAFKRTNLIIHLANGLLLGVLTRQILILVGLDSRRAAWLAFFSAAAWMLHPFLVSTTMYVVQRMTQLATLFTLAGMVTYLHGRSMVESNKAGAYVVMTAGLIGFTVLGVLCKESGALLPMLLLVLELTVLSNGHRSAAPIDKRWSGLFLVLPSVLVLAYLAQSFLRADVFEMAPTREFSLYERLLTQPRVVATYLQHWFIPKLYTSGVFQDHIVKSTGLLAPVTTLVAALMHLGLIAFAVVRRRQLPLLAFAILFFYSYHLLESTVLNLELYFEHRNYLPVAFLFLPLIVFVSAKVDRRKASVVAVAILVVLAGFTRYSATVWSDFNSMVEASAYKAPTSARAQVLYARILLNEGQYDASMAVIDRAAETIQGSVPLLQVSRAMIRCSLRQLSESDMDDLVSRLAPLPYDARSLDLFEVFVNLLDREQCAATGIADLDRLFSTLLENDKSLTPGSLSLSHVHYLGGLTALKLHRPDDAMAHFTASVSAEPKPSATMKMAELMATSKYYAEALELSDIALRQIQEDRAGALEGTAVLEGSIREFRRTVRADMEAAD